MLATMSEKWPLPAVPRINGPAEVQAWWETVRVMALLFAITLVAYALDPRTLQEVSVWSKPLKFQLSLVIHFTTLALLYRLLVPALRASRWIRFAIPASAFAALFEIFWIMFQAGRGRASHFNKETLFEGVMYGLMGFGSLLLVLAPLVLGVLILRSRARYGSELQIGAGIGLVMSALTTLVIAGYLSNGYGHWVGDLTTDAAGLPILGWSTQVGDLRVAHFFATHAMQVLPLAVVLMPCTWRRRSLTLGLSGAYLAWISFVFIQALMGQPFIAPAGTA